MSKLPLNLTPGTWNLDEAHTEIGFSVRHAGIARSRGRLTAESGVLLVGETLADSKLDITIDINTINTDNEDRDNHLRSSDFFKIDEHPKAHFVSTEITGEDENLKVTGDLTLRGVTQTITFDVDFAGVVKDPMGSTRTGAEAATSISRKDFGLTWNAALEAGGVVVGDKVSLQIDSEFVLA